MTSGDRDEITGNVFAMTDLEGMPSYFWLVSSRLKNRFRTTYRIPTKPCARTCCGYECVGGEPGQPGARRNLYLFDRCLRSRRPGGLRKIGLSKELARHCGCGTSGYPTTLSRLPPSSSALRIQLKSISARDPNGHARYGTPWCRRLRPKSLVQFIKRKGGINRCAERFRAHRLGRPSRPLSSE